MNYALKDIVDKQAYWKHIHNLHDFNNGFLKDQFETILQVKNNTLIILNLNLE